MAKEAVFTMKLEPELRDAFMAAAAKADRPASQIVRDVVQQDRDCVAWLQRKVDKPRADIAAGRVHSHEDFTAGMDRLMADLQRGHGKADAA